MFRSAEHDSHLLGNAECLFAFDARGERFKFMRRA